MKKIKAGRQPNRSRAGDVGVAIVLIIFGCFFAFPLVYAINAAFKPLDELFIYPPKLFVRNPTTDNFSDLFLLLNKTGVVTFTRYMFNSIFVTAVGTAGHILVASMAAYVLAKYRFPGSRLFFSAVTVALMFTGYVISIPRYLIMANLGLINTYLAVIVPAFASPMGLFLMKQFMESSIPDVLIEAAKIDGAKEGKIFVSIVMPLVKPAILTLMIFSIQALWNDAGTTFLYKDELKMLPFALQTVAAGGVARTGAGSAATLFMMILPLICFILAQSNIVETMASSGIKE
ncbi:MAG: carbohydrate ABC transporter permease [Lachnospiraceae bacterium]|jgi:ABC-type glycerol-3-phosphate transport system permease component|nr:carbohydrate ABC transporter permease [Lachnospiraceae bacterium]